MPGPRNALIGALVAFAGRLRFPILFGITATLFVIDLLIPDPIPILDEAVLGLAAAMLATWRATPPKEPSPDED